MKKLLVLFFVAAMCVPSYGDILVYKFTGQLNPWIDFTDSSYETATVSAKQITGYIIEDFTETWELINDPTLICCGKNGKVKWGIYFDINKEDMSFNFFDIGKTGWGQLVRIYETDEHEGVGTLYVLMYGKMDWVDIGKGAKNKVYISRSLKGTIEAQAEINDYFTAFGNITATLDSKYTQNANKTEATQEDTVDKIIAALEGKGYGFGG
jgi:hypothetical protein